MREARQEFEREAGFNIWHIEQHGNLAGGNGHWSGHITAGEEDDIRFELVEDAASGKGAANQAQRISRQGAQPHAVHTRGGNSGKWDGLALNQLSLHAAFAANPLNGFHISPECLQNRESGIHAPPGPAGAYQQPHRMTSLPNLQLAALKPERYS